MICILILPLQQVSEETLYPTALFCLLLIALSIPGFILAVSDANKFHKEVDLNVRVCNDLSTSCPVHNDSEDFLAHSER